MDEDVDGLNHILGAMAAVQDAKFHTSACKCVYYILQDPDLEDVATTWGKPVLLVMSKLMPNLDKTASAEAVAAVLLTLLSGECTNSTARFLEAHCLVPLFAIIDQFRDKEKLQRLYIAILGKMAITPDIKEILMRSKAIERTCDAMHHHRSDFELQEHGARTLCALTKGYPAAKDYIAARLDTLQPFELLTQAMRMYSDNAALAKSCAMALWSIAFKNVVLKSAAGQSNAFMLLAQAIRVHRSDVSVLPHLFIAACNLCVNHAPNQGWANRGGMVQAAVDQLRHHSENPQVVFSILNCLNAMISGGLDGQDANHTSFDDADGQEVLDEVCHDHAANEKITSLGQEIQEALRERKGAIAAELTSQTAQLRLTRLEQEEMAAGLPRKSLEAKSWTEVVRQAELRVKHKKGRATSLQQVTLYRHTLVFFERVKDTNRHSLIDEYYMALLTDLAVDQSDPKVLCFHVSTPSGAVSVRMICNGRIDAEQWMISLNQAMPTKSGLLESIDVASMQGKKKPKFESRFAS